MYASDCIQIIILGLAIGGIPFGVLLAKLFKLPDPRYVGSGNIGATNMLRLGNKKVAALTLLLDAAKGWVVVWLAQHFFIEPENSIWWRDGIDCLPEAAFGCSPGKLMVHAPLALAVLAAALGHMYSPWLKFKGGKGVATLFGGALAFSWPVAMASLFVWFITVFLTRYVSLGSILALAVAPLVAWLRVDGTSALILAVASAIAIWKHRENIKRLRKGFEPKVSFGKGQKS